MKHVYIDHEQREVEFFITDDREPTSIKEVVVASEIRLDYVALYDGKRERTPDNVGMAFFKNQIMQKGKIVSLDSEKNLDDFFWPSTDFEYDDTDVSQWKRYKLWKIRATPKKLSFRFFDRKFEEYSNRPFNTNATIILPNTVGLNIMASIGMYDMQMYFYPDDKNRHRCDTYFTQYPSPTDELSFGWRTNLVSSTQS